MANQLVVVIGGNFGGLTAALDVKAELGGDVDVLVVSAADRFVFSPSLIWLPFGKRSAGDSPSRCGRSSMRTASPSCTPRRPPSTRRPGR